MPDPSFDTTWRNNPQDYMVVCRTIDVAGEDHVEYRIYNMTQKIAHVIENQAQVRKLVQEMLDAGVRLVTLDEARQILNKKK